MARWLPYHIDGYFLRLQAALRGGYKPQFTEDIGAPEEKEPGAIRAAANRALDAFSSRADAAIRKFQQRKGMR